MKLLFISEYFPPQIMGGGEINLFLLTKALVKKKIDVHVLTSYHKGSKRFEIMEGVKVHRRLKTGETPNSFIGNFTRSFSLPQSIVKEAIKLSNKIEFDTIHFIGVSIIAAPKLRKLNIPLVSTIESYVTLCPKGDRIYYGRNVEGMCSFIDFFMAQRKSSEIGKMKNKWYLKYNPLFLTYVYRRYRKLNNSLKSTRLIAISKHMQTLLQKHRLQSTVIPNALDISSFKKEKRKSGKLRVLYLGSLTQFKGPHILLKAINGLNCHCDLYGEGNLRSRLQRIIEKDGLDATIHNNVSYEKVPSLYAQADIVVFPSIWPEPFGRIAIEGMAAGKPVIGSRIGGIAETIEEGTGILVDPGKVRDLNDALEILAHDKNLRIEMGKKGKKVVSKKYTENKVITKLIEFYNEEGI